MASQYFGMAVEKERNDGVLDDNQDEWRIVQRPFFLARYGQVSVGLSISFRKIRYCSDFCKYFQRG